MPPPQPSSDGQTVTYRLFGGSSDLLLEDNLGLSKFCKPKGYSGAFDCCTSIVYTKVQQTSYLMGLTSLPLSGRLARRTSLGRNAVAYCFVAGLALLSFPACDQDDTDLVQAIPRIEIIDGLVTPGQAPADGVELVADARRFETALADYRRGNTNGISTLDPQVFATDITTTYNVNYGDLGAELPQQVTELKTITLDNPKTFTPADAVRVSDEVRAYVKEVASAYDRNSVRLRYVRVVFVERSAGNPIGFNVYVNAGAEVSGVSPRTGRFRGA